MLLSVAVAIKSGLSFAPLGSYELVNFPVPPDTWGSLSYGMRTLVFITGYQEDISFSIVGAVLTVITIIVLTALSQRTFESTGSRVFLALVIVSPIGMVLFNRLGQGDVLVILGAIVFALLGPRLLAVLAGLILMILGNPEQAVVALFSLLILSFVTDMKTWRRPAVIGLSIASGVFIILALWARAVGAQSRLEYLPEFLSSSFYAFAANLPLSVYAGFAAIWVILGWVFVHVPFMSRTWLLIALVVVPGIVTIITVDQTRVFVGVTTLSVLVLGREFLPKIKDQLQSLGFKPVLGATVVLVMFLPIIDIWGSSGHARTPYLWIFTSIVPQIKTLLIG